MKFKRCEVCGRPFTPRPQVPKQSICSAVECQRERKRRWQQTKLKTDPDYRDNQRRANKAWAETQPGYWRDFRASHPDYTDTNRVKQRERNKQHRAAEIAKMDVSKSPPPLPAGTYRMTPITPPKFAKMDEWIVEISVLSGPQALTDDDCKERT